MRPDKTQSIIVKKLLKVLLKKTFGPGSPRFSQRIEPGSSDDLTLKVCP